MQSIDYRKTYFLIWELDSVNKVFNMLMREVENKYIDSNNYT